MGDLFSEAAGRRLQASAPARAAAPSDDPRRLRRPGTRSRSRTCAAACDRTGSGAVADPLRAAGLRQDHTRPDRRAHDRRRVRGALGGLGDGRERAPGARTGARTARRERAADDPVPRRDPPLQQGAAGRVAARSRGRPPDADRRDDREPVLRGQLGAALARPDLRARGALARDPARGRPPRGGGARRRRVARGRGADRAACRRRRAERAQHPGADRRDGARRRASRWAPITSRTRRASGRSPTTRAATGTTTSSRRGSSRRGRATCRRRSTTSPRCSRAARTRASSCAG